MYCKTANKKIYEQLNDAVQVFRNENNVKETLYDFNTQQNEALNMAVSRYVPKLKHFGTTMSLDTRIRCVIGTHNMGYHPFYLSLLANLGCLETMGESSPMMAGIIKVNNAKKSNKYRKQKPEVKRQRKYGIMAKTKQQVYEERVDRANKLGTYQKGVAVLEEDTEETEGKHTQQSSNVRSIIICPHCGKKGHKTTRSKFCDFNKNNLIHPTSKHVEQQTTNIEITKDSPIVASNIYCNDNIEMTENNFERDLQEMKNCD